MSLEAILTKIRTEADLESQRILKNARGETAKVKHRYARQIQEKEQVLRARYDARVIELSNVHLAQANRTGRQIQLLAEEKLIEQCFTELEERLAEVKGEQYDRTLRVLVLEGMKLIGDSATLSVVRDADLKTIESIIAELQTQSPPQVDGRTVNVRKQLTLDRNLLPADRLGGVYMVSNDGKKVVDNTFKAVLNRNHEKFRIKIAKILFRK